jgi:hypothetical protein
MKIYSRPDALDKKYKPLILQWLADTFGYEGEYPHNFQDQYINWSISQGYLSIHFDFRCPAQEKLFSIIPMQFKGAPQFGTLKIVNDSSFYLHFERFITPVQPRILNSSIMEKHSQYDAEEGTTFFTYDWRVSLSDGSTIKYHNQSKECNLMEDSDYFKSYIQTKQFTEFLDDIYTKNQLKQQDHVNTENISKS